MKIVCSKPELLKGVSIVLKAIPTRTTMPILECILINATTGKIQLTANDMELGIETVIEGSIEQSGMIALNARFLSELVRKLPDADVVIETSDHLKTTITCDQSKFDIQGMDGEEFSYLPYVERDQLIEISQFTLKEVIRQTIFSISDKDSNRVMTGELFELEENKLQVASLDGHRVSIRNIDLNRSYQKTRMIVPGKTLQEVSKILTGDLEDIVHIYYTANHILFEFDQTMVVSRLIDGEYFQIKQMLTSDYETKVTINKKVLLDCIDRATLLSDENDKRPIIMKIADSVMKLQIRSKKGKMNEKLEINQDGKELLIGFNPKFYIDALRVIDEEEISLYMTSAKAPCFIKDEKESFIYLILPVNFSEADFSEEDL